MTLSPSELTRYSRHLALPEVGTSGQERLRAARVLIVGVGGLGSPAALYLAASGVGTLGLVDCDRVELSNLQRQVLFTTADVGRAKVEAARERLLALSPDTAVVEHAVELRAANVLGIVRDYDVVIDGTDRLGTRYVVNDACVLSARPLVSAAIYRFDGQAFTYVPGRGPCYRCLFPDAMAGAVANCGDAGVLGVLPAVLGAIQATEAIKLIVGTGEPLVGRLLAYDALEMRVQEFRVHRRDDCAVCGDRPSITEPCDPEAACAPDMPSAPWRLTATELRALLDRPGNAEPRLMLIDVREPHEYESGHLVGAVLMPLAQLEASIGSIERDATPVFICATGARSLRACAIAGRAGFARPANLDGGMRAWNLSGT